MDPAVELDNKIYTGCVKWFNTKAGYGFLTDVTDSKVGEDVFVHHSGVKSSTEQYTYLVQGEYVWFNKEELQNDRHKYKATQVRGVSEGLLMCETRALSSSETGRRKVVMKSSRDNKEQQ